MRDVRFAARDAGFTLIELLVALALFAVIAAAGTGLLTTITDAGRHTAGRLDRLAAIERTLAVVERDLTEIADAPLKGDADGLSFERAQETGTATVSYRVDAARLERRADGVKQHLLDHVVAVRWRYLSGRTWQDRWPMDLAQAQAWPAAVALDLDLVGPPPAGHLRRVVDLPVRPLPPSASP